MKNPTRYTKELQLLEHTHYALSCAQNIEEFYTILTGILVSPQLFNFRRAFVLKLDERHKTIKAGFQFTSRDIADDSPQLNFTLNSRKKNDSPYPETGEIRKLYDAYLESLTNHAVCDISDSVKFQFPNLSYMINELPENHILLNIIQSGSAQKYYTHKIQHHDVPFLSDEFLAGCLTTRKGQHGILIVDNGSGNKSLEDSDLLRFQWFLAHASMTLSNIELIEQLTHQSKQVHDIEKLKNNFLSIVSHELLTPLTTITGYLNLLSQEKFGELNTKQDDVIHTILQHGNHLNNMVNDLIEIAEVNSGEITDAVLQAVNPANSIVHILPKLQMRKGSKSVEIHFTPPDPVPSILADPDLLERILYHLLDNAIKFTLPGGSIKIEIEKLESEVEIRIYDSGIGISEKNLKRIFDHFYQVEFTLERQFGGMGIGLTIVKLLLDASAGKIRVISTPHEGSMFAVCYPLIDEECNTHRKEKE